MILLGAIAKTFRYICILYAKFSRATIISVAFSLNLRFVLYFSDSHANSLSYKWRKVTAVAACQTGTKAKRIRKSQINVGKCDVDNNVIFGVTN